MNRPIRQRMTADSLAECIRSLPVFDTHSHMTDAAFPTYLAGEVVPFMRGDDLGGKSLAQLSREPSYPDNIRPLMKRLYRDTGHLAYKRAVTRGCRELYGFKGEWIDWDDRRLFARASEARSGGIAKLYLKVMEQAKIERVLRLSSPWDDAIRLPADRQAFLMYIDEAVVQRRGIPYFPLPSRTTSPSPQPSPLKGEGDADSTVAKKFPPPLGERARVRGGDLDAAVTFDEHLHGIGNLLSAAKSAGVVGLKVGLAARRSLRFEAVAQTRAERLFRLKRDLTPAEQTEWEDFMLHRVAAEAGRQNLPLVFHTGFLWGIRADLARTRSNLLANLCTAFPDTRFVMLHAAPYEGETAYMCAMFPNVYLDFTWTAMLSPTRFRSTLNEWIESVPESKFMWGSDSSGPEAWLGVTLETKELVAEILGQRVRRGQMSEQTAFQFATNALRDNARGFYGLT
jgi:hypothetical protein